MSELFNDHPWNLELSHKEAQKTQKKVLFYGVGLVFADGDAEARGEGADAAGLGLGPAGATAAAAGSILTACEAITCHLPSRFA